MRSVKIKRTEWIAGIAVISVIIFFCAITVYCINRLAFNMGNYDVDIWIEEGMTVDYSTIGKEYIEDDGTHIFWFSNLRECQKLIDYMKDNNLKIKPGPYHLKRYAAFEDIKKTLVFEKLIDSNYDIYILIYDYIPADYLLVGKKDFTYNSGSKNWFNDLKRPGELEKLIEYMRSNNLRILAGEYVIKRYANFDDMKKEFVFGKLSSIESKPTVFYPESCKVSGIYKCSGLWT